MSDAKEKLEHLVNNVMMEEIDTGHLLLQELQGDLSAAVSSYCLDILEAADTLADKATAGEGEEAMFNRGMAEGYCRVVMALTGLLMAYDDKSPDE